jgi:hypothetical protein
MHERVLLATGFLVFVVLQVFVIVSVMFMFSNHSYFQGLSLLVRKQNRPRHMIHFFFVFLNELMLDLSRQTTREKYRWQDSNKDLSLFLKTATFFPPICSHELWIDKNLSRKDMYNQRHLLSVLSLLATTRLSRPMVVLFGYTNLDLN